MVIPTSFFEIPLLDKDTAARGSCLSMNKTPMGLRREFFSMPGCVGETLKRREQKTMMMKGWNHD